MLVGWTLNVEVFTVDLPYDRLPIYSYSRCEQTMYLVFLVCTTWIYSVTIKILSKYYFINPKIVFKYMMWKYYPGLCYIDIYFVVCETFPYVCLNLVCGLIFMKIVFLRTKFYFIFRFCKALSVSYYYFCFLFVPKKEKINECVHGFLGVNHMEEGDFPCNA